MVLGIIGAIAGAASLPMGATALPNAASATSTSAVGVSQGASGSNQGAKNGGGEADPNDPRLKKFGLRIHCDDESPRAKEVKRKRVVLRKGKVCFVLTYS